MSKSSLLCGLSQGAAIKCLLYKNQKCRRRSALKNRTNRKTSAQNDPKMTLNITRSKLPHSANN